MNLNVFLSGIADQFDETDACELTADCVFQELDEWSSLTALSVIAYVKTTFNKKITAAEIRSCRTLEDLYNRIKD